ncbi:PREDICTED: nuclear RNA export factor 2-like [Dufourea novaeangliae]|uniref:Nuclear RNA export factor 2 n=1 Tax=Dufourea novaeangliae TaxID=178035 RepID=A0A154P548_DUFNO|nr:PREDICTED: nuclear RNA export factor 2-like [Dufourea novaeangliae]KZC07056.1 Nuclear RNA export factor 2 [Dufourea novaeangliae]
MASTEVAENPPAWEPLRLTHIKPSFNSQESSLAARQDLWHKFILYGTGKYKATEVLKRVIDACDPEIILPVMYKEEGPNKSKFLAKCNPNAIENLVKQGLCVILQNGQELRIDIVLGFLDSQELKLNPNRMIAQALYYRYEPTKKVLNLDDFENEKSLGSIFCPVSLPKVLQFVLRCSRMGIFNTNRDSRLPIRELSLKYNKLTAIILFEKFFNYHLTKLDLRYNQIGDVDYLRYFSEFKISELWLDGNPLCEKYNKCQDYVQAVKNIFPHLQKLDGIVIDTEQKFVPNIQSNFLRDDTRSCLIKQFVKHYFTLYDQDNRQVMNGLYDRDALYSMTLGPVTNYVHKQIIKKFVMNRNLLKFVDYAKCEEFLLRGPEKIISALRNQPSTTHNFKSFHIDLLYEEDSHLAISVQGLFSFREISCPPMFFNRTFIIAQKEDNEYCITNDQCYLDGAPANSNLAGNSEMRSETRSAPKFDPIVFSVSEKEQLLTFLRELTTMNMKFCQQYLEEAHWDIRTAITTFMNMYTVNNVPPEAFI